MVMLCYVYFPIKKALVPKDVNIMQITDDTFLEQNIRNIWYVGF